MGLIALLAAALAALLAVASPSSATALPRAIAAAILPGDGPAAEVEAGAKPSELDLVDRLMAGELEEFLRYRAADARDERLDFSTDECTAPIVGSSGRSFDFTEACLRHDFGYRNYGRLGLLDSERRRAIDERFLEDMRAHCASRPAEQIVACFTWAQDFHRAVRAFGWIPARRYR